MNKLYIITGPPGVGKSTISKNLAYKLPKSVLIEGDTIYNFFISDHISPWMPNAPLELFWNNTIYLIKNYLKHGYNVIFNYIIDPTQLKRIVKEINNYQINFKILIATPEVLIKRDKERPEDCQMKERTILLLNQFINYNYKEKDIIDTSNLSIEETVNKIINS